MHIYYKNILLVIIFSSFSFLNGSDDISAYCTLQATDGTIDYFILYKTGILAKVKETSMIDNNLTGVRKVQNMQKLVSLLNEIKKENPGEPKLVSCSFDKDTRKTTFRCDNGKEYSKTSEEFDLTERFFFICQIASNKDFPNF